MIQQQISSFPYIINIIYNILNNSYKIHINDINIVIDL